MPDAPKLVCIVDDDQSVRKALGRLIRAEGYETISYATGRECLDGDEISRVAAIIVDVAMPGIDGFELHTLLRESGRDIPTIFISSNSHSGYRSRAASLGAIAFLDKPCNATDLLDAINTAAVA